MNLTKTTNAISRLLKKLQVQRLFSVLLAGFVLLTTSINLNADPQTTGAQIRQRLEETDNYAERPKTTGQFLDEARGDIPFNERMYNITRDSSEALQQLGQEYTSGVKENVQNLKDRITGN